MSKSGSEDPSSLDVLPAAKKQRYLTFSERYFQPLYKLNYDEEVAKADETKSDETVNTDSSSKEEVISTSSEPATTSTFSPGIQDHVKILLHSNGICVLTLAPSHPILTEKLKVEKVDFQVSKRVNRLQNAVRGKGKKGGQFFADDKQTVAFVSCTDGSTHAIRNGVRGALVEVNDRLVDQPELLISDPFCQGFLAIVLPRKNERDVKKLGLVVEDEYLSEMRKNGIPLCTDIPSL